MIHFRNLFSFQYLFLISFSGLSRSDKLFALVGIIAIVLAIVLKLAAVLAPTPVDKTYRGRMFNLLLTVGLWEVIWFGCRYEDANFFGSHFVALLGLLIGVVWLGFIIVKMFRNYSSEKQVWEKEQVRLKYLPR